jgi:hypothetical protein
MARIEDIYNDLKGKTLVIPDLKPVYAHWPTGVNCHYEKLKAALDDGVYRWIEDERTREKYKAVDLAYLASASVVFSTLVMISSRVARVSPV